jgi:periplasmic protein CpxP/Spy
MSDHSVPEPGSQQNPNPTHSRRWLLVTGTALAAALVGAVASQALSQGGPPWHPGGFMGPHSHMGGPFDPARAEDRADRMVRHLAIEIDASAEQQDKLRMLVKGAVNDLLPLRQKVESAHERGHSLLTQPTIDRAAIEAFRAEHVAALDAASRRVAKALGDAAEVLTPDQRRKIDDHLRARRTYWHRWHRG